MLNTDAERIAAQIELEKNMTNQAINRYQHEVNRAKQEDDFSNSKPATNIINQVIEDYTEVIKKYITDYTSGKVIRRSLAAIKISELLKKLSIHQIAFISAKTILNTLYREQNRQHIALSISTALDTENKMVDCRKLNKHYYESVMRELNGRSASQLWKSIVVPMQFKKKHNFHTMKWDNTTRTQVGMILLELFVNSTGLVEYKEVYEKKKTKIFVVPTEETLKYIEDFNDRNEALSPLFLPMVCPPKDWAGVYDGGYISPYLRRNKFIKNNNKKYLKELTNWDLRECYKAINTLQATEWQINKEILDVIKTIWEEDKGIAGVPQREDLPAITFPYPDIPKEELTEEQKANIRIWKNESTQNYKQNIKLRSVRLLTANIIKIADDYSKYDGIWFPHQLDFRGRLYPIPALLQPQGNDLAKGLLRFGKGKPLENEENANWLRIHGANCWGEDKCSYEDRIKWVKEREGEIKSYAENSTDDTGWTKADKPFQFLAFCKEYTNYLDGGYDTISYIPIALDGTCNGLQHYSALLRDEVGAKGVNLIDSDKPNDIYEVVANRLKEILNEEKYNRDIKGGGSNLSWDITSGTDNNDTLLNTVVDDYSDQWLKLGINRKLTKRPVMCLPYGLSRRSCRGYIEEYLTDTYGLSFIHDHFNRAGNNPQDTIFKVTLWLEKHLWQAIEDTLSSAILGMDYLKKVTRLAMSREHPIEWVTPIGLLIHQEYENSKKSQIRTELYGSLLIYDMRFPSKGLDKNKQVNGVCPNYIHSMDAACLMRYLTKAVDEGITSFNTIHDSYGTLATDTTKSARLLREAFIEIYRDEDILGALVNDLLSELDSSDEIAIPIRPAEGSLDINQVLESKYFFN